VVLGLFALSQVLVLSEHGGNIAQIQSVGKVADGFKKVLQLPKFRVPRWRLSFWRR